MEIRAPAYHSFDAIVADVAATCDDEEVLADRVYLAAQGMIENGRPADEVVMSLRECYERLGSGTRDVNSLERTGVLMALVDLDEWLFRTGG